MENFPQENFLEVFSEFRIPEDASSLKRLSEMLMDPYAFLLHSYQILSASRLDHRIYRHIFRLTIRPSCCVHRLGSTDAFFEFLKLYFCVPFAALIKHRDALSVRRSFRDFPLENFLAKMRVQALATRSRVLGER